MKKITALLLTLVLLLLTASCLAQEGTEPRFVTVQEWLDAKGECGNCMVLLKIREVRNPVSAIASDDTGTIALFSGQEDGIILEFMNDERILTGYWVVLANPRYNPYEGTVEMADWTLMRLMHDI